MKAAGRRTAKTLREDAVAIWSAGVRGVDAGRLLRRAVRRRAGLLAIGPELRIPLASLRRIVVVGAGKAGGAMAEAVQVLAVVIDGTGGAAAIARAESWGMVAPAASSSMLRLNETSDRSRGSRYTRYSSFCNGLNRRTAQRLPLLSLSYN